MTATDWLMLTAAIAVLYAACVALERDMPERPPTVYEKMRRRAFYPKRSRDYPDH